jgi:transposase
VVGLRPTDTCKSKRIYPVSACLSRGMGQTTAQRCEQEQKRLQANTRFEAVAAQAQVVAMLGTSHSAVSTWHSAWVTGGVAALAARLAIGRPPNLRLNNGAVWKTRCCVALPRRGTRPSCERWSGFVALSMTCSASGIPPAHVWRLLGRMDWSCKKPARRGKQRSEAAITRDCRERWPKIRQGPCASEP